MITYDSTLWDTHEDLLDKYEDLKEELSAMSLAYEHPPLLREACEKLDASVEYVKELSPLAAPELDRLREERFRQWEAADRPYWYGEMIEVAYEFNAIRDALLAVIAELEGIAERAGERG
ncbi:hypothetical protein [Mycolicibacterium alvei]|uniref:DUF4298 domain-containing protein n=1 Tax=Mycolicibacterium alvei TaxID=67081 RepID=A0A6N4UM21_9MYCO|nr:hypothetical protein [Mycolicibacterium alvei]MCV6999585.1 hypothetical protein [Mycolicibacterium alvei]BBX25015.1 hypothetical protein MALV_01400 [Mycolicibacterium alvei]